MHLPDLNPVKLVCGDIKSTFSARVELCGLQGNVDV